MGGKLTLAEDNRFRERSESAIAVASARPADFEEAGPFLSNGEDDASLTALRMIALVNQEAFAPSFHPIQVEVFHRTFAAEKFRAIGQTEALAANGRLCR